MEGRLRHRGKRRRRQVLPADSRRDGDDSARDREAGPRSVQKTPRMTIHRTAALLCIAAAAASAQTYRAERLTDHGAAIVRLTDTARDVEVSVLPSVGNRAYEMKVHGNNILYFPSADIGEFQARPRLSGIPFLAPWADLLNEQAFWANGKRYAFNMELGNVRGKMPIHGLLVNSPLWEVTAVTADDRGARVTSRLAFWKSPDLMEQWPFAHEYEMTYELSNGMLEVRTTVTNLSDEPMPLVLGYHSFFQIPDIPRDDWVAHYPARVHIIAGRAQYSDRRDAAARSPESAAVAGPYARRRLHGSRAGRRRPRPFLDRSRRQKSRNALRSEIHGGDDLAAGRASRTDTRVHLLRAARHHHQRRESGA